LERAIKLDETVLRYLLVLNEGLAPVGAAAEAAAEAAAAQASEAAAAPAGKEAEGAAAPTEQESTEEQS
jgi:hypothetical protein